MRLKRLLLLSIIVLAFLSQVTAQQNRVDSIVAVLQKTDVSKAVDTTMFTSLTNIIEETALDDAAVASLEKAAEKLTVGDNIFWDYKVRRSIMNSLTVTDKAKAIAYGKRIYESLLTGKTLLAVNLRSYFFRQLRFPYRTSDMLDDGFAYFNGKLKEFQLKNDSLGLADCYYVLGGFYRTKGLMAQAIYNMKKSVSYLSGNSQIKTEIYSATFNQINLRVNNIAVVGSYYFIDGEYNESLKYSRISFNETSKTHNAFNGNVATVMALAKLMSGSTDSVEYLLNNVIQSTLTGAKDGFTFALQAKALYMLKTGQLAEAETLLQQCWQIIRQNNFPANAAAGILNPDYYLSLIREKQNRIPDAIVLLQKDLVRVQRLRRETLMDYKLLSGLYEREGNAQQANLYNKSFIALQDSLLQDQKKYGSLSFETEQEINANELSITKLQSENKISSVTRNFTIGLAVLLIILAAVVYSRFKAKQKDNLVLENTLNNLKSTQTQLIQSEKMASLGELTAGIAHEIQNPLNFVNNFSDVNKELLEELKEEADKGNIEEVKAIANDVIGNEEKINHHGKRADAIVKGMLQHSRSSSGQKEPTDINSLCDEYLRLSYHGLRAKNKDFNATMKTDFDENLGKINIIPQDIGRVLLNLYNNAFYAVNERLKAHGSQPIVSVTTKKSENHVLITVSDNGNGIPQNIVDKIFQPFFTTKPTGQGTGLGLSLSYDIIKAHGGEITVNSKVADPGSSGKGEGTQFIIQLPI